jgi:hypothetical protein
VHLVGLIGIPRETCGPLLSKSEVVSVAIRQRHPRSVLLCTDNVAHV